MRVICLARRSALILVFLFALLMFSGCTETQGTLTGAAIGTGTGAGVGYAIGGKGGAALGGTIGGLAGGAIGNQAAEQRIMDEQAVFCTPSGRCKQNRGSMYRKSSDQSDEITLQLKKIELEEKRLQLERERLQLEREKVNVNSL